MKFPLDRAFRSFYCPLYTGGASMLKRLGFLALCFGGLLLAQVETSTSIRGIVTDASGAVVPRATVTIRNTATNENRGTNTNDSGYYAFPSVIPGTYDVTVTQSGFKKAEVVNRVA